MHVTFEGESTPGLIYDLQIFHISMWCEKHPIYFPEEIDEIYQFWVDKVSSIQSQQR